MGSPPAALWPAYREEPIEDTVEFFSLVLSLRVTRQGKADLVAYRRQL